MKQVAHEMRATVPVTEKGAGEGIPSEEDNDGGDGVRPNRVSRRRTKTGCLTCRKRRIKCGEERPTCGNCIKSKRQCEGYNQRVVFKDPMNTWGGSATSATQRLSSSSESAVTSARSSGTSSCGQDPIPLQMIAPKQGTNCNLAGPGYLQSPGTTIVKALGVGDYERERGGDQNSRGEASLPMKDSLEEPSPQYSTFVETNEYFGAQIDPNGTTLCSFDSVFDARDDGTKNRPFVQSASQGRPPAHSDQSASSDIGDSTSTLLLQSYQNSQNWSTCLAHNDILHAKCAFLSDVRDTADGQSQLENLRTASLPFTQPHRAGTQTGSDSHLSLRPGSIQAEWIHVGQTLGELEITGHKLPQSDTLNDLKTSHVYKGPLTPTDDEAFDYPSEEMDYEECDHEPEIGYGETQEEHLKNNDLGIIVALQSKQDSQEQQLRTYRSVIDSYGPGMLSGYLPSARSSPLRDSTTARIFCHFINVTGPAISMYERHPANPSLMFQGRPISKSQQHIWASASLLLGFYEVWCAEHQKWSNHLLGSNNLIKEIDFKGIASFIKRRDIRRGSHQENGHISSRTLDSAGTFYYTPQSDSAGIIRDTDVDEDLVGMIMGRPVLCDQDGWVKGDNNASDTQEREYTSQDLEIYENQRDLFWWYCKQDVYQSVLSGNRLFLNYELWSHCPPRAQVGRLDAIYGTFDHLILLLGRVAEFVAKDLRRKRLVMKENCGSWDFDSGTQMPVVGVPSEQQCPPYEPQQCVKPATPPMPAGVISGMKGKATSPRYISTTRITSRRNAEHHESEFEAQTIAAEEEWLEILAACKLLEHRLGSEFQALGPEHSQPIQSPFGPALQYRTYSIAGIWIVYYLALIILHRAHPSMPPATMTAASLAAKQTSFYANAIGRVIAGIAPSNISYISEVNTQIGAALIESSFGLFVAAVQYQDLSQREWTIQRLMDINRLTGWQTAIAIVNGCETSWTKAAELGRGPIYTRLADEERVNPSMWNNGRRRIDLALLERNDSTQKLMVSKQEKVHYVLGLLGLEEDLNQLELEE